MGTEREKEAMSYATEILGYPQTQRRGLGNGVQTEIGIRPADALLAASLVT
jgi:hypothetical protein